MHQYFKTIKKIISIYLSLESYRFLIEKSKANLVAVKEDDTAQQTPQ